MEWNNRLGLSASSLAGGIARFHWFVRHRPKHTAELANLELTFTQNILLIHSHYYYFWFCHLNPTLNPCTIYSVLDIDHYGSKQLELEF